MTYQTITYEVADRVAVITFDRPESLNAINVRMMAELAEAYASAERDDDVWTIVVTGAGTAFCTGADVTEIPEDGGNLAQSPYLSTYDQWEAPQEATPPFRTMTKPILTAVNGICCGAGLDLVTTSDIVIASDRAEFFDPHVSIGVVSGREMVRLARVLPRSVVLRMALTGRFERMGVQRAYELGLVTEVVEHDHLMDRALEVAGLVNKNARWRSGGRAWPSTSPWASRCTKGSYSRKAFANASSGPRMRSRDRVRSGRSAHRCGARGERSDGAATRLTGLAADTGPRSAAP